MAIASDEARPGGFRAWILLVVLLVSQFLVLTTQAPDPSGTKNNLLERIALRTIAPLALAVGSMSSGASNVATGFAGRRELRLRVAELEAEVSELRRQHQLRLDAELELELIREGLDYVPPTPRRLLQAEVVFVNHRAWLRSIVVRLPVEPSPENSAEDAAGVMPNGELDQGAEWVGAAVTTRDGLVGRIVSASGRYARAQLLTDRASSVGVMIERTRRQGVAKGRDLGELTLEYVDLQADVRVGDRLLTAGIDGVYPRGIPVGVISQVSRARDDLFHSITLRPEVDLSKLDQVFVLLDELPPSALTEDL